MPPSRFSFSQVMTVQETDTAIDAFKRIANNCINGLAVLDADGKLTGNLSLRDLRAIGPDGGNFFHLFRTVK